MLQKISFNLFLFISAIVLLASCTGTNPQPSESPAETSAQASAAIGTSTPVPSAPTTVPAAPTTVPTATVTQTALPSPTPTTAAPITREKDGMRMVNVPAGPFTMGSASGEINERPVHTVTLSGFWIDQTEVTNAMFATFVAATKYQTEAEKPLWEYQFNLNTQQAGSGTAGSDWRHPRGIKSSVDGLGSHPVVHVSWNDSVAYCEWAGSRLPTEAEWEKASRGTDGRTYPWGETPPNGKLVNFADVNLNVDWADNSADDGQEFTAPVGSFKAGASPYGVYDMAGNVWEWVADWYGIYFQTANSDNPTGPASGDGRVLRGGSWNNASDFIRTTNRAWYAPVGPWGNLGFRCARSQ